MAMQICPKCKEDSFTWFIDNEISDFTIWGCYKCTYQAIENEVDECICEACEKKTKCKLKDSKKEYWCCFTCNKITEI